MNPSSLPLAVEEYLVDKFSLEDNDLISTAESVAKHDLPDHAVSPLQGQMLYTLAKSIKARQIVEVGSLAGYSTIWLARAVGIGGKVISFEPDPKAFQIAMQNIRNARLHCIVELVNQPALEALQTTYYGLKPVDLMFMDGDKPNYVNYMKWAIEHGRPGGMIIADNVIREGQILDTDSSDSKVIAVNKYLDAIGNEPRLTSSVIPMIGSKPFDGMAISLIND